MNKYPDPAQFILDYNPDLQFKLVRCNATHSELALNDSIPSLGLLSSTYGDETPIEWLKIQFGSLNDFAEVSTKIAKEQLSELSEIFLSEYYYINAAEICFFIARFKSGKYGRFYGSIDPLKITSAMLDYVSERRKDIERKERERYRNQREKEIEERGDNRISYAEYIEIKHRAVDAGTSKSFVYDPGLRSRRNIRITEHGDLNEIYRRTYNDTTLYKPVKEGWYIELDHSR